MVLRPTYFHPPFLLKPLLAFTHTTGGLPPPELRVLYVFLWYKTQPEMLPGHAIHEITPDVQHGSFHVWKNVIKWKSIGFFFFFVPWKIWIFFIFCVFKSSNWKIFIFFSIPEPRDDGFINMRYRTPGSPKLVDMSLPSVLLWHFRGRLCIKALNEVRSIAMWNFVPEFYSPFLHEERREEIDNLNLLTSIFFVRTSWYRGTRMNVFD